jgi:hypothetical protein
MTDQEHTPWLKVLYVWVMVSASHMTLLEWFQLVAAGAATIYSLVQTYKLLRKKK